MGRWRHPKTLKCLRKQSERPRLMQRQPHCNLEHVHIYLLLVSLSFTLVPACAFLVGYTISVCTHYAQVSVRLIAWHSHSSVTIDSNTFSHTNSHARECNTILKGPEGIAKGCGYSMESEKTTRGWRCSFLP